MTFFTFFDIGHPLKMFFDIEHAKMALGCNIAMLYVTTGLKICSELLIKDHHSLD